MWLPDYGCHWSCCCLGAGFAARPLKPLCSLNANWGVIDLFLSGCCHQSRPQSRDQYLALTGVQVPKSDRPSIERASIIEVI